MNVKEYSDSPQFKLSVSELRNNLYRTADMLQKITKRLNDNLDHVLTDCGTIFDQLNSFEEEAATLQR